MIRILVVEDHPAIGAGLMALLDDEHDFELVGSASDARRASELIRAANPDVVLCDVMLGGDDAGLDLLRSSGGGSPRFLMFSAYSYPGMYQAALKAGAAGYLSKTAPITEIVEAIRAVNAGRSVFPPAMLRSARGARARPSPRELETIALLSRGATNREIAEAQSIGIKTVESQLRRLFDRYDVSNRTELARLAEREGWLMGETS